MLEKLFSEDPTPIITAIVTVFGVIGLGFGFRRINWLTAEADATLLKLIVRVLMPCLIFANVLGEARLRDTDNLIWPPLLAVAMVLSGFAAAYLVARLGGECIGLAGKARQRTFAVATGLQNYGYLPLPIVEMIYPDSPGTLGVLMIFMMSVELTMWTVGVALLGGGMSGWYKRVFNPPTIAIAAAVLLNFYTNVPNEPPFVGRAIHMLGDCTIPLGLLLVGATISDCLREIGLKGSIGVVGAASFVRLLILPLVWCLLAAQLSVSQELKNVLIVEAAMPAAMFPVILSRLYGGDPPTAVRVAVGTSFVGLATMVIWLAIGQSMI